MSSRRFWPTLLVIAAACARSSPGPSAGAPTDASRTDGAAAPRTSPVAVASSTRVHWAPRVAPTPFFGADHLGDELDVDRQPLYAPLHNNYGTRATGYLGHHRVGLLDKGRRFLFDAVGLTAVEGDAATSPAVDRVLPVPSAVGGGFLFAGPAGLFFADSFGGPLRKLSADRAALRGLAPHSVLLGPSPDFVSTSDGQSIPGAPKAEAVFFHHSGFAVATSALSNKIWLTGDGRSWKPVAGEAPQRPAAVEDGDALLLFTDHGALRIARDGKATRLAMTLEEQAARNLAGYLTSLAPEHWGPEDAYEGALIDAGWTRTGRSDDEWMGAREGQLLIGHARTGEVRPLVGIGEGCAPSVLDGEVLLTCLQIGKSLSVSHVDLATGATTLERTIEVKRGFARNMGYGDAYPLALFIAATCEGDADGGLCVRAKGGSWTTFPPPPSDARGQAVITSGEALLLVSTSAGGVELRAPGKPVRVFTPEEMKGISGPPGLGHDAGAFDAPAVSNGMLRTDSAVRTFYTANAFKPVDGDGDSYYVDLPLAPGLPPSIHHVSGVVASAGRRGLRLSAGRLWETDDAWATWREVDAPPTGVPHDLAGAMCRQDGCVLGAWARIGWED